MMKNHQNKVEIMRKLGKNFNAFHNNCESKTDATEKIIKSKDKEIKFLKSVFNN